MDLKIFEWFSEPTFFDTQRFTETCLFQFNTFDNSFPKILIEKNGNWLS